MKGDNNDQNGWSPDAKGQHAYTGVQGKDYDKDLGAIVVDFMTWGRFTFIVSLYRLFVIYGSWLILPFIRHRFGIRAFGFNILFFHAFISMPIIGLFAALSKTLYTMPFVRVTIFDTAWFFLHSKLFLLCGVYHAIILLIWKLKGQYEHPDKHIFTYSFGESLLWPLMLRTRLAKYFKEERYFQWYGEPALIATIAMFIYFFLSANYGFFIGICACCIFGLGQMQAGRQNEIRWDIADNLLYQQFIGEETSLKESPTKRSIENTFTSVSLATPKKGHGSRTKDSLIDKLRKQQGL